MQEHFYALTIVAHPDDESFLFAGTTLKLEEEGKTVAVICATNGEKGADRLERKLTEEQMAQIRIKEMERACNILHCECTPFNKYPDGGLHKSNFQKLVKELVDAIERYQPQIIMTFGPEGVSGHNDHITIGQAATEASLKANHKVKEVWLASMPASSIDAFNDHLAKRKVHHTHYKDKELMGVPDEKLLKIDISKYTEKKLEALKAHESQYLPHFYLDIFQKFECFEVIKLP